MVNNTETNFDVHAEKYNDVLRQNFGFLACDVTHFAQYKVKFLYENIKFCPNNLFEFGVGVGNNLPFFKLYFPNISLYGSDISDVSLAKAIQIVPELQSFRSFHIDTLKPFREKFDVVFLACVLHHIPLAERAEWISALAATLRPGGVMCVFEHNLFNPVTRFLVKTCPLDIGVKLVKRSQCLDYFREAGLSIDISCYTLFSPWRNSHMVKLEKVFSKFPFGCQWCIIAYKY